ncbi:phosphotransferase [Corynebacterium sp. ES2715-CONJ3]|uniref:phosphotransferase n=1 Tax=Corynebacterium sp. ES2715-CONJ3 TaxID=2974028 RepID=UPI0021699A2B|nr:phosphotransferase [Corynebacterium sp. ES2715-CONJ3]MCS4492338.1 hypothetical protein [Corynebacterium sp. ES2715-CONJ3]
MISIAGPAFQRLSGTQTNASYILGDQVWKVLAHPEPGIHPDVEITAALHRHVAEFIGEIRDGDATAVIITSVLPDAQDCWAAREQLDPHDASAMGAILKEVHEDLAHAFPTGQRRDLRETFLERLHLFASRTKIIEEFLPAAERIYSIFDRPIPVQRIHGDLHLGQILRSHGAFYLIDFEGEPTVPLSQRRLPDSPMRDLAGMIRSFDYAGLDYGEDFLTGYGDYDAQLLEAYMVDKVLYEIDYEAHHRPDWVQIPLNAARTLLS